MELWDEVLSVAVEVLRTEEVRERIVIPDYRRKPVGYLEWNRFGEREGWEKIGPQTPWIGVDQHWLCVTTYRLPASWMGKQVMMSVATGATDIWDTSNPQFFAFVDGELVCGLDTNHTVFPLFTNDTDEHRLELFCYTSSDKPNIFVSVVLERHEPKVAALCNDLELCVEVIRNMEENRSARAFLIRECMEACRLLDYRVEETDAFLASVDKAEAYLHAHVWGKGVDSLATVSMVGHTHIDLAWKWTMQMTREKCIRSFATVCNLMDRYSYYRFTSSQPQEFAFVKENMPQLYDRIQKLARTGRWEMEGGAWVECDCNLTSGESLVRQCLYGMRFFREEFGQECKIFWMPDTFGFTANLPQIIKKCGLSYFLTTKISWNETDMMPHDTFFWKGIDGTKVLAHMVTTTDHAAWAGSRQHSTTYNGLGNPSQVLGTWERYRDKEMNDDVLSLVGYGDGGGGPTSQMLENERRMEDGIPGLPAVRMCTARTYFDELARRIERRKVPEWSGELYLEYHRGTYTTMARIKKENRMAETETMDSEFFATLASVCAGNPYPKSRFDRLWLLLLRNQFHDILPGSAIGEVYEQCWREYARIHSENQAITHESLDALSAWKPWNSGTMLIWNSTSFLRSGLVQCPLRGNEVLADDHGPLPCQKLEGFAYVRVEDVPPKGYRSFRIIQGKPVETILTDSGEDTVMENSRLRAIVTREGELKSLFDKAVGREVLAGEGNKIRLCTDRPREYDAWNIGKQTDRVYDLPKASSCVVGKGPLFSIVRTARMFGRSEIRQDIVLENDGARLDFRTNVLWNERHLMLRTFFPLAVTAEYATFDVAFGNVRRSTVRNTSWDEARTEVPAHKWGDVSEEGYGVALLNTCKYGYRVEGNVLSLSLLRGPENPNPDADKGEHSFLYSLYPHEGSARSSDLVAEGYFLQQPLLSVRGNGGKANAAPPTFCFVSGTARNVVIETIKQAESGDGCILRLVEEGGKDCWDTLHFGQEFSKVWSCSLDERKEGSLVMKDGEVSIHLKPFEVCTVLVCR